jgi:hypothetical protein
MCGAARRKHERRKVWAARGARRGEKPGVVWRGQEANACHIWGTVHNSSLGFAMLVGRLQAIALASSPLILPPPSAFAATSAPPPFTKTPSGLQYSILKLGSGQAVERVTFHVVGRLVGKQGWVFENSQKMDDEPYRLQMGRDAMIAGLEEGLLGMNEGGIRRLLIPSPLGYTDREHEPIPRSLGQRQRLYTTVLNEVRLQQETVGLGSGNDVAGVVLLDVQLLSVRPPAS